MAVTIITKKSEKEISQRKLEVYDKYSKVINWGRAYPVEFASRFFGIEMLDIQKFAIYNSWFKDFILWLMARNSGKALSLDTIIPTPDGNKKMRDINEGDYVFDESGKPALVTLCSPIFTDKKCYEITFDDGEVVIASQDHLWQVKTKRLSDEAKFQFDEYGCTTLSTEYLANNYVSLRSNEKYNKYMYSIPVAKPMEYSEKKYSIEPYAAGRKMSNGNIDDNSFVDEYLFGSVAQRYEFLRGFMDKYGNVYAYGKCKYVNQSKDIVDSLCKILKSLNIKHTVSECTVTYRKKSFRSYCVYFFSSKENPCFKIKRKYNKLPDKLKDELLEAQSCKTIMSIKKTKTVPTKCIAVDSPRHLYLCGEKNTVTHNTIGISIYTMLRSILLPYHTTYFLGNTGDQAKEIFMKIEKLAKRQIESFVGSTDIFMNELIKNGATGDGFTHSPTSFQMKLFNGAEINTLNSDIINIKGKRANLVCFDEAGWFSNELFIQAENFVNQDENFKLGGNINTLLEPKNFPRQLMYASSASDTSTEFYKKFKLYSMAMLMGDQKYFSCNFDANLIMKAKYNGEPYPSLLNQDKINNQMASNRDLAMRELFNKFSADTHEGQILTRGELMKNTKKTPPLLYNDTGNKQFILTWDSARLNDNSTILAAEVYQDPVNGWCANISNVINLVDTETAKRTPMIMPEQVDAFKEILLQYNGVDCKKLDYENILAVVCDSGAGGQMIGGISDYMLSDWTDVRGESHRGIIDRNHKANEASSGRFPNAINIMRLIDPKSHRNEIFDAAERITKLGVISFPAEFDEKDYILTIGDKGEENIYNLSIEEQTAMAQISKMKDELILMCKYTNAGNVTYNYPPERRNKVHDDRAFCYGLLCWYLSVLRRGQMREKPKDEGEISSMFRFRKPIIKK